MEDDINGEFKVDVRVETANSRGALAHWQAPLREAEGNIENISIDQRDGRYHWVSMTLLVRNRIHLARIVRRVRAVKQSCDFIEKNSARPYKIGRIWKSYRNKPFIAMRHRPLLAPIHKRLK